MKSKLVLIYLMFLAFGLQAQTTLRIEDASSFTSGFCAFEGSRQSSYSGADNGFYINISNSSARGINWKVNVPSAGTYTLRWRYANAGSSSATTGRVLVNESVAVSSAAFPKTSSWSTWTTTTASVSLGTGVNTIRLETITSAEFANIDWIEIVGNNPAIADCSAPNGGGGGGGTTPASITIQENTTGFCLVEGTVDSNNAGYTGAGFANANNQTGAGIEWRVNASSAGSYQLVWRYANGTTTNRTGRVLVNGSVQTSSVGFNGTGSWTTWVESASTSVNLSSGVNTIRLDATNASGLANIDWIRVTGTTPSVAACSGTTSFTLTTTASPSAGGSITRNPNATSYTSGTVVTLTAVPASGYTFTGWSGAVTGSSTTVTVTMDANETVTANFTQNTSTTYTLTTNVNPSGGGSVTRSPNASSYTSGTVVTLTATPASGYSFSGWSGDASGTSATTTVTMSANRTVTANFTQNTTGVNFDLVGYATMNGGTTGGTGGTSVTVSTGTALQNAINNKGSQPLIIFVNGTITPANSSGLSKIDVKDVRDVSILGVGTSGELNGIGLKIFRAGNIIVRNLKIHHVSIGDKDCISIEGPADHIWVDHCELYNQYQGVDQDFYDGLLDAKAEAEYITYSWNYLHDSWKTGLAGSSESDTYDRKITMHHNFYENCNSRLPLYRGGQGHVFNNYYKDIASTAINSRIGACLQIENNYFLNTNNPYVSAYSSVVGYGEVIGNTLVNSPFSYSSDIHELGTCTLNIPYSYSQVLHNANQVPSVVPANAGVGKINVTAGARLSSGADAGLITESEEVLDLHLTISPNPTRGVTSISFELPQEGTVAINVADLLGRSVKTIAPVNYVAGKHEVSVDLRSSENGVYICNLNYSGKVLRRKILLDR